MNREKKNFSCEIFLVLVLVLISIQHLVMLNTNNYLKLN